MEKIYFALAGIINLITTFIHIIYGQIDLINPLLSSNLNNRRIGELVGNWHIVTLLLIASTFILLKAGFGKDKKLNIGTLKFIGVIYILIAFTFIVSSIWFSIFAAQWLFLLPIGLLTLFGIKKSGVRP